jgi:hypothetical protein
MSIVFTNSSNAQKAAYWVVETNVHQKVFTMVRLYDVNHHLLETVTLKRVHMDISKARNRRKLDDMLYEFNFRGLTFSKKTSAKNYLKMNHGRY